MFKMDPKKYKTGPFKMIVAHTHTHNTNTHTRIKEENTLSDDSDYVIITEQI